MASAEQTTDQTGNDMNVSTRDASSTSPPADGQPGTADGGLSTADMAAAGKGNGSASTAASQDRASAHSAAGVMPGGDGTSRSDEAPLFASDQAGSLRTRWQEVQTGFVDEPRTAVQQADGLVAEVMQQLATTFANERKSLEAQWSEGQQISTEDLRIALQRYRSFFNRLLSL